MWCRACNRFFRQSWVRRALSVPLVDRQQDVDGHLDLCQANGARALEEFGTFGQMSGLRVLDLGCGLGGHTIAAAHAGAAEVVGVDMDLEKVRFAKHLAVRSGAPGVTFGAQNGAELAFDSGRFDLVLLLDVIEHVADPAAVLDECARVLRRGGRVLVGFPPYRSPWGAHLFSYVPIPWVQLVFADREILEEWRRVNRRSVERGEFWCSARRARAIMEAETTQSLWDCNGMTIARFLALAEDAPLELEEIRYKALGRFGWLAYLSRGLCEILVTRVTAVLVA